jgi:hypothetical protein
MNITPEKITELKQNEIFVFGSNESGIHGAGAAKQALKWGAKYGQPEGLKGNTYAIPTKNKSITRTLSINEIKIYVDRFIEFAVIHSELTFLVTEIGCGLAGLKPIDVAPLFADVVKLKLNNIHLPTNFIFELMVNGTIKPLPTEI